MKQRTCRYGAGPATFICWYVDILNAEGDISFWKKDPKTGSSITPLTLEFYTWSESGKEIRDWIKDDTPYTREIRANRDFGSNSRSGLNWKEPTAPLCDNGLRRGMCS